MSDSGEIATKWLSDALGLKSKDTPFPWQLTLLDEFRNGDVPSTIDLPTGLGKTAVIAIWLVARALGAPLPRRIVYVVDRRAVVDQATEVAMSLRSLVERTPEIGKRLGIPDRFLPVSTLRGQYVDNREWLDDPAAPAIIVGTVDMIGSRLLFEGYGVSRKMRPYHAGLLGLDTLLVLDEAHLVPPFEELLRDITNGADLFAPPADEQRGVIPQFKMLSLSATGRGVTAKTAFRLAPEDFRHPEIERRLRAPKRITVHEMQPDEDDLVSVVADKAWKHGGDRPIRCIVFCDKREDAVRSKGEIERRARGDKKTSTPAVEIASELFVGGRRVFERQDAAKRLEGLGFIAGKPVQRSRPAFLFATSAAEVGVDLDSDCMVCDLVTWERMVQRLGRINRRGEVPGGADVCVVVKREPKPDKPTQEAVDKGPEQRDDKERKLVEKFEAELAAQRALRKPLKLLCWNEGTADASTGAIRDLNERAERCPEVQQVLKDATTPAPLRPALTAAVVGAWAMTSLESHSGRPAIDPWLRGWKEDEPQQTQIVWRKHLPVREEGPVMRRGAMEQVAQFFEAAPAHTSEVLETETFRVTNWLKARVKAILAGLHEGGELESPPWCIGKEDFAAIVLPKGSKLPIILRLWQLSPDDKDARDNLFDVLVGATLIVDARIGGLKEGLLDDKCLEPPETADDGTPWMQADTAPVKSEGPITGFRVRVQSAGQSAAADRDWRERIRFAIELNGEGEPIRWLVVEKWRSDSANEDDRSAGRCQLLEDHRTWAEERARALARSLNLPEPYKEMLAVAAFLHDEGKRSHRWQRAFNAPAHDSVWAKTEGPINFDLLDGYRHEFGSVLAVESHQRMRVLPEDLRDLALHMIAAHHGFARPFIETRGCDAAPPSALEPLAKGIALRFERLQQRWGPWGLAWWESLLRAADQQASRDNDARDAQAAPVVLVGGA